VDASGWRDLIVVHVVGGLGNQMFQYAAALALARRHGATLRIDASGYRLNRMRSFQLDRLTIPAEYLPSEHAKPLLPVRPSATLDLAERVLRRLGRPRTFGRRGLYREPHYHFDRTFFELKPPILLDGYFQSERYFAPVTDELHRHFRPRLPLAPAAAGVADMIERAASSISVHVRLGDYVSAADAARTHGALDGGYYRRAMDILASRNGGDFRVFLFSDAPDEAARLLAFIPDDKLVVVRGDTAQPWDGMVLMGKCRHHIIANSSFSWWGAWLDPRPDKVVIAPRAWFTSEKLRGRNTCDLYPERWILV
jgi:Glycosyl transferase family 11